MNSYSSDEVSIPEAVRLILFRLPEHSLLNP